MKNLLTSTLPSLFVLTVLSACGGGSENTQEAPQTSVNNTTATVQENKEPSTQDLVAASDFDFRTDMKVEVTVSGLKSESGKLVFYHGVGFHDEKTNIYYPAYENRLTSMFALNGSSQSMQVDGNWEYLTVEWLPMDAGISEVYKVIKLTGDSSYSLKFE
ncbi:hypothetical protein ABMY35_06645 [Pseudoalteromonas sp. BZB3]|uniref:hypothetical protein n=1 Tax=Pseudoalteromonas sp. BZB3 TaxID=3136670 RepID=UPI0032C40238